MIFQLQIMSIKKLTIIGLNALYIRTEGLENNGRMNDFRYADTYYILSCTIIQSFGFLM
jgi:hypothetical protein